MNSAGHGLSNNRLLTGTENMPATANKKNSPATIADDNSLKNKDFSALLDDQQRVTDVDKDSLSAVSDSGGFSSEQTPLILEMAAASQVEPGNSLPVDGLPLPLAPDAESVSAMIDSEVVSIAEPVAVSEVLQQLSAAVVDVASGQGVEGETVLVEEPAAGLVVAIPPASLSAVTDSLNPQQAIFSADNLAVAKGRGGQQGGLDLNGREGLVTDKPVLNPVLMKTTDGLQLAEATSPLSTTTTATTAMSALAAQFQVPVAVKATSVVGAESSLATVDSALSAVDSAMLNRQVAPEAYRQPGLASVSAAVPVDVGKPGWSEAVTQKVMWMSSQNINTAEIALDPPELGSLQVRITTQADQTSVQFISAHGQVRDALDQTLSRLREMMENQGLDLADVDVSDQRQQGAQSDSAEGDGDLADNQAGAEGHGADGQSSSGETTGQAMVNVPLGLVDQYV